MEESEIQRGYPNCASFALMAFVSFGWSDWDTEEHFLIGLAARMTKLIPGFPMRGAPANYLSLYWHSQKAVHSISLMKHAVHVVRKWDFLSKAIWISHLERVPFSYIKPLDDYSSGQYLNCSLIRQPEP